jgi:chemotaxis protein histidine kinase CheA
VSGATILGNGRVALILDVPGLAAPAERQPRPAVQQSISLQ